MIFQVLVAARKRGHSYRMLGPVVSSKLTDDLDVLTASIIRARGMLSALLMGASSTPEMPVSFYETLRCNIIQDKSSSDSTTYSLSVNKLGLHYNAVIWVDACNYLLTYM